MVDRLLLDIDEVGRTTLTVWPAGKQAGEAVDLACPPDPPDLRWYLEDYLRRPYGLDSTRGPAEAARLAEWGEALFEAVFGSGRPARRLRGGAGGATSPSSWWSGRRRNTVICRGNSCATPGAGGSWRSIGVAVVRWSEPGTDPGTESVPGAGAAAGAGRAVPGRSPDDRPSASGAAGRRRRPRRPAAPDRGAAPRGGGGGCPGRPLRRPAGPGPGRRR